MEKAAVEKYIGQIINGRTNGYGMIESLSETQVTILCGIIKELTGKDFAGQTSVNPAEFIKDFTLSSTQGETADQKLFDRYVEKVAQCYTDLVEAYDYDEMIEAQREEDYFNYIHEQNTEEEIEAAMSCRYFHDRNDRACDGCSLFCACVEAHSRTPYGYE